MLQTLIVYTPFAAKATIPIWPTVQETYIVIDIDFIGTGTAKLVELMLVYWSLDNSCLVHCTVIVL